MSNSKPNSLIHYVDFNSSKMKGSKRSLSIITNVSYKKQDAEDFVLVIYISRSQSPP
jgi:hypothetical protein